MTVYESSVLNTDNPEEQKRGFKRILDTVLDPALEMCRRMADMNSKDATGWEKNIFLINCLDYLQVNLLFHFFISIFNFFRVSCSLIRLQTNGLKNLKCCYRNTLNSLLNNM